MQSSQDIAKLLERFDEPLRGEGSAQVPRLSAPVGPASHHRFAQPPRDLRSQPHPAAPAAIEPPAATKRSGATIKSAISALAGIVLVPAALLFALWWQGILPGDVSPAVEATIDVAPVADSEAQPKPSAPAVEFALSSPGQMEADAGDFIAFPITIDATRALPGSSIVAITGLPQGTSFSEGRPFGTDGWSVSPEEIGGLRLRAPAKTDIADLRLELLSGDGTVLSQSQTQLSITPPQVAVAALGTDETPSETVEATEAEISPAEQTASLAPPPQRKPDVKVRTVKTVAIAPPRNKEPYDGGYGLGQPADEPVEWMVTKTAVDMHAKAEQKSETVKVAEGGLKVQVKARDKNWIQVHDPESSTTGWIYNRFLKPAE